MIDSEYMKKIIKSSLRLLSLAVLMVLVAGTSFFGKLTQKSETNEDGKDFSPEDMRLSISAHKALADVIAGNTGGGEASCDGNDSDGDSGDSNDGCGF